MNVTLTAGRATVTMMVEGVSEPVHVKGLTGGPNRDCADNAIDWYRA